MKNEMMSEKIIFLHIPKCAGTTFNKILAKQYGSNIQFKKVLALKPSPIPSSEEKDNFSVFAGHYSYGLHKYFDSKTKYITFFRDPVTRIISHYKYVSRTPIHDLYTTIHDKKLKLIDYALSDYSLELDNGMVRQISGTKLPINKLTRDELAEAKKIITRYFVFGLTELFDESIVFLKHKLNWNQNNFYYKMRVSPIKENGIDNFIKEKIMHRNNFDMELYNWCVKLFKENINEIDNFNNKVKYYKFWNSIYSNCYGMPIQRIKKGVKHIIN